MKQFEVIRTEGGLEIQLLKDEDRYHVHRYQVRIDQVLLEENEARQVARAILNFLPDYRESED